ncbi:MAG: DNA-binding response regulator [Nitrospirae bacterium]|nr:MAG: DNA-binding response regulator [Nitrospirota bacterium]
MTSERASRSILIADDDPVSLTLLHRTLRNAGYEVSVSSDGAQALAALSMPEAPPLAILDWVMPEIDGLRVCEAVRGLEPQRPCYLIVLTSKTKRQDVIAGLNAGADDYIVKPFDPAELLARVRVGFRVVDLQAELAARVTDLEWALQQVKQLRGLIPICSYCKRIRNDQNFWLQVEEYVMAHTDVQFSHGVCPHCYESQVQPQLHALTSRQPRS